MAAVAAPSFGDRATLEAGVVFPSWALEGCETALCLFSAAWLGRQDAYWVAQAGLRGTCVDLDAGRLEEMAAVYPDDWTFFKEDAYQFTNARWALGDFWDAVTLDPFTTMFEFCAKYLELWCAVARRTVILGHGTDRLDPPDGWTLAGSIRRSDFNGGVYWLVYQRD